MGKYEPLTCHRESRSEEIWDARFSDVERVLGFPLLVARMNIQRGGQTKTRSQPNARLA